MFSIIRQTHFLCSLSRNSMLAESYRFAVDKYPQMTSRGPTDNPAKRELQCKAAIEEIKATERSYVLLLNDILKVLYIVPT